MNLVIRNAKPQYGLLVERRFHYVRSCRPRKLTTYSLLPNMRINIVGYNLHHAITINIRGNSYRLKEKRKAGLLGRAPVMTPAQPAETD